MGADMKSYWRNFVDGEFVDGGYGNSGYGREKGREALWNHVQTRNVAIKLRN